MKQEFLTPAAILTQSILKSVEKKHDTLTPEIVSSAFLDAYKALKMAEENIKKENAGTNDGITMATLGK